MNHISIYNILKILHKVIKRFIKYLDYFYSQYLKEYIQIYKLNCKNLKS